MSRERPVVATDIDDVLCRTAQGFTDFSNTNWGHCLTVDDYDEDWSKVWGTPPEVTHERAELLHSGEVLDGFLHIEEAALVLGQLKERYRLVVATSRRSVVERITHGWLQRHYGGLFEDVYFSGIYDRPGPHGANVARTKNDLLLEIGAQYLIDDQLKHCIAAEEHGVEAVLFGDYAWNRCDEPLPAHVTRCADWTAVGAYFAGKN